MKTALVTGGANRIGAQIAKTLFASGYFVIVHYKNSAQNAQELVASFNAQRPNSAQTLYANLSDLGQIRTLARQIKQLDLLVNNASSFYPKSVLDSQQDDWDNLINSNVRAGFFLTQQLVPQLNKSKGSVVSLVDIHSQRPLKNHAIYNIAKAGVAMMTKTLAKELAPDIRVNGVSPGSILWPEAKGELSQKDKKEMLNRIPLNRQGNPEDIAQTVLFLANSPYITGQIIAVDGGRTLNQ